MIRETPVTITTAAVLAIGFLFMMTAQQGEYWRTDKTTLCLQLMEVPQLQWL
jgi:hypothetical protein